MNQEFENVLALLQIQPVLMDIGASSGPPAQWSTIARHSIYVGFDPDQRDLHDIPGGQYARSVVVNSAVTSNPDSPEVTFYFTHSPYCSSTLVPDSKALANYLFADLFRVEREGAVRATSLNEVIERLGLQGVDWFKTDSQGTDLSLFQSLSANVRDRVLVVDIEPGLIDAYQGEDLFVDSHKELMRQGFWISHLDVKGTVRMRRSTLQAVANGQTALQDAQIYRSVRSSPGWCEARYLRTLEALDSQNAEAQRYALLWVFSMIDKQWGYALDIAQAYKEKFGQDAILPYLHDAPLHMIEKSNRRLRNVVKQVLPTSLKVNVKRLLARISIF